MRGTFFKKSGNCVKFNDLKYHRKIHHHITCIYNLNIVPNLSTYNTFTKSFDKRKGEFTCI